MSPLDARTRARLPDSAFAYVDSKGRRRLPINDEAHVRNALARFDRTRFESEAARERARKRILAAAKKHGIVPIGFITSQLRSQRRQAAAGRVIVELGQIGAPGELEERLRSILGDPTLAILHWSESAGTYRDAAGREALLPHDDDARAVTLLERHGRPMAALVHDRGLLANPDLVKTVTAAARLAIENERLHGAVDAQAADVRTLPMGPITFLLTDIEDSTGLVHRLGDRYADLLAAVRHIIRTAVVRERGREVDARGDEFFAVFERPAGAVAAALSAQRAIRSHAWPDGADVRVRMGLHSGHPALTDSGYVGLPVHVAARVCSAAHGGQIIASGAARGAIDGSRPDGIGWRSLGSHQLHGLPEPVALFQVEAADVPAEFPPPRATAVSFTHVTPPAGSHF
jgi:class 3 adenylate cyclase